MYFSSQDGQWFPDEEEFGNPQVIVECACCGFEIFDFEPLFVVVKENGDLLFGPYHSESEAQRTCVENGIDFDYIEYYKYAEDYV